MNDDAAYRRARARVHQLRGFYTNLAAYVFVNLVLLVINLIVGRPWWFYWVLIGWGIGLAAHAFAVFGPGAMLGKDWEDRKIQEYMAKDKRGT